MSISRGMDSSSRKNDPYAACMAKLCSCTTRRVTTHVLERQDALDPAVDEFKIRWSPMSVVPTAVSKFGHWKLRRTAAIVVGRELPD